MYTKATTNVAPTNKHTILATLNYIHIESIANSRTHQTNQLKVATVCFKYTAFSIYRQIKSTNDNCRMSPGLNSYAERGGRRRMYPPWIEDDSGNDFRLVPGFLRSYSGIFSERFLIVPWLVASERTRLACIELPEFGSPSYWTHEITSLLPCPLSPPVHQ